MEPLLSTLSKMAFQVESPLSTRCPPGWVVENRVFTDYDFWWVEGGRGEVAIDGKTYRVSAGNLFWFSPGQRVSLRQDPQHRFRVSLCHFMPIPQTSRLEAVMDFPRWVPKCPTEFQKAFARGVRERENPLERTRFLFSAFAALAKQGHLKPRKDKWRNPRLEKLFMLAGRRPPGRYSVNEWAREAGMDRTTATRLLFRGTGQSPKTFLDNKTRDFARSLLEGGMRPVDAAGACGYGDPAAFAKACRRWFSVNPGWFQKQGAAGFTGVY